MDLCLLHRVFTKLPHKVSGFTTRTCESCTQSPKTLRLLALPRKELDLVPLPRIRLRTIKRMLLPRLPPNRFLKALPRYVCIYISYICIYIVFYREAGP